MLCLLFMLNQSFWKCLFFWLIKLHSFWGHLWLVLLWGEYGAVIRARGLEHENPACSIDSHLHWVSYSGWISENKRHGRFWLFIMTGFCTGTNESGLELHCKKWRNKERSNKTKRKKKWHTEREKPREKLSCSSERGGGPDSYTREATY